MVRGSCLCGRIRFEVAEVPIIVLCHCSICRKANGSAFDAGGAVRRMIFGSSTGGILFVPMSHLPERFAPFAASAVPALRASPRTASSTTFLRACSTTIRM
jgi:hypothetical protein